MVEVNVRVVLGLKACKLNVCINVLKAKVFACVCVPVLISKSGLQRSGSGKQSAGSRCIRLQDVLSGKYKNLKFTSKINLQLNK